MSLLLGAAVSRLLVDLGAVGSDRVVLAAAEGDAEGAVDSGTMLGSDEEKLMDDLGAVGTKTLPLIGIGNDDEGVGYGDKVLASALGVETTDVGVGSAVVSSSGPKLVSLH